MIFSDTSTKQGIVEDIDFLCDTDTTAYPLAQKVRNVNRWYDRMTSLLLDADGRWQWDDTNWTDLPVGVATLVNDQQDYSVFTAVPSSGQDYLKITRVEVKNASGNWVLLKPIDQVDVYDQSLTDFLKTSGMPQYYDKVGASIMLYPKPATNYVTLTGGLKVYFQRAPSYFSASDTTKQPGFPSLFHRYLSYGASFDYCVKKQLPQKADLEKSILEMEDAVKTFFVLRNKDERLGLTSKGAKLNFR
jgi:hypothetical protein